MLGITDVAGELARLDAPWEERRPKLIAQKRERMAVASIPFFRATAPLFFARLREEVAAPRPPELEPLARWLDGEKTAAASRIAWCAGDVHLENFGSYRSVDGVERFGLNDFDDALIAPIEIDVLRLTASILVAARCGGAPGGVAATLARGFLREYVQRLGEPTPFDPMGAELGPGTIHELLKTADEASRLEFLEHRAPLQKGKRAFVASDRYRLVEGAERASVLDAYERAVASLGDRADDKPGFYKALDVVARTAGLGSLGCGRYAILIEGKAADAKTPEERAHGNGLLELKEAKPASLARRPCPRFREFADEADRVISGQLALRGGKTLHLGRTTLDGTPYYLRRLSHREQRVDLDTMGSTPAVLANVAAAEARALAHAHARSRATLGLNGPIPAPLEREQETWLLLASRLAGHVEADYLAFSLSARP
jgi:uncharacterized protein (DUF2252 family)